MVESRMMDEDPVTLSLSGEHITFGLAVLT